MSIPDDVHAVNADYHRLAARDAELLTEDEARSILYFRTDQSLAAGRTPSNGVPSRVFRWVTSVRAVDEFIATHGRLPRENNRLPRAEVTSEERVLVEWLRYQRRPRTRETHCSYQRRRLEALPGFRWDPIADSWSATFRTYEAFLTQNHRAPAVRSADPFERSLAAWAAKQRHLRRRGRLNLTRESELARLSIWTWGAP